MTALLDEKAARRRDRILQAYARKGRERLRKRLPALALLRWVR